MNRLLIGALALSSCAAAASAGTVVVDTSARGYYFNNGSHSGPVTNYITGTAYGYVIRDFFAFTLPSAPAGQVLTGATLTTYTFEVDGGAQTISLYDYTGTSSALINTASGAAGLATFNDLGSGTLYGSHAFTGAEDNTFITYSLNSAALADISAHLGGFFAIGGQDSAENGGNVNDVYASSGGGSSGDGFTYLTLTFGPDPRLVPLPAAALSGLTGLALVGLRTRRRRA